MHAYLKERARDFRNHGFCIVEHQLCLDYGILREDNIDDFFAEILAECAPIPPLVRENSNGDMVVKKPATDMELKQAMFDSKPEKINSADFAEDGVVDFGRPH